MIRLGPSRGLDAFNFLVAASQTGFGAFIPAYLATHAWTQVEIGIVLTIQTVTTIVLQVPAGMLVDATRKRGRLVSWAVLVVGFAALLLAVLPMRLPVAMALILQAGASGLIYPAIAAISLAIAGRAGLSLRLGRNASYAAIGGGVGAAAMGLLGSAIGPRWVFVMAAVMSAAAALCLRLTRPPKVRTVDAALPTLEEDIAHAHPFSLLRDRRVLIFAVCIVLFNLYSGALLPVAAVEMTRRMGPSSGMLIAAWIIIPQVVVALLSPLAGQLAEHRGRRPVLVAGFMMLPLRGLLFMLIANPYALGAVQVLDGLAGAAYGLMIPLMANDVTRGTNRASLCLSLFGLAGAFGSALSTTLAGVTVAAAGISVAYGLMTLAGLLAVLVAYLALPETK